MTLGIRIAIVAPMHGFSHPWIIVGTDTEVGKTVVTAGILRLLAFQPLKVSAIKLVQTGCCVCESTSARVAPDLEVYRQALSNLHRPPLHEPSLQVPYCFEPACSPHLAAELQRQTISTGNLCEIVSRELQGGRFVLAECAGGLLVPLNSKETTLDFLCALPAANVLLVADNRLGMINHTLLTLHALDSVGIRARGIVLNNTTPVTQADRFLREDNLRTVARFGRTDVLAEIPWIEDFDPQNPGGWGSVDEAIKPLGPTLLSNAS